MNIRKSQYSVEFSEIGIPKKIAHMLDNKTGLHKAFCPLRSQKPQFRPLLLSSDNRIFWQNTSQRISRRNGGRALGLQPEARSGECEPSGCKLQATGNEVHSRSFLFLYQTEKKMVPRVMRAGS